MTAVTFSALKTRIQREVNKPSPAYLTDIGEAIVTAIRYYECKPVWFTETSATLSLTSAANTVALPANFKRFIALEMLVNGKYLSDNSGFKKVSFNVLQERWIDAALTQQPQEYAIFNNTLYMNCLADQTYTLRLFYNYGDTTYPSADGDSSVWFDEGVDIIRYEAMAIFYSDRLHDDAMADRKKQQANGYYNNLLSRHNTREAEYSLA